MRITNQQITAMTQNDLNSTYTNLTQAQTVLATQQRINSPADDPIGTASVLLLQGSLAENNSFAATASDATSWLQATDSSVNGIAGALTQARSLAVQGASDTVTPSERQAIAANVAQLLQQAVQSGNGQYGNRFILSGYQTGTPPFTADTTTSPPTITYNGDNNAIQREVAPGQNLTINVPGATFVPAMAAIAKLQADLQTGTSGQISADIATIDTAHDQLLVAQAQVGANSNRVTALSTNDALIQQHITGQISLLRDADMAKAAIDFSTRSAAYQAALQAAAKLVQPTLMEFLK